MPALAPKAPVIDADDAALLDKIIEPAAPQEKRGVMINEGFRLIALGETGSGKTSLMRACAYWTIIRGFARFALIHDTKGILPEYPQSIQVANVQEWYERRGFQPGDPPIVSFRGDHRRDITCTAQEVAELSLMYARKGMQTASGVWVPNPSLCVIEEVSEAASEGRRNVAAPAVLKLAEQGRKMGVSLIATTQETVFMPAVLRNQATCISFGRITGTGLNYLDRINLPPAMVAAIRGPDDAGLPNHHFVLYFKGQPWDGQIHRLNKRTVEMFD
jgi:hypothetical protein